jgi:hypothetical protein
MAAKQIYVVAGAGSRRSIWLHGRGGTPYCVQINRPHVRDGRGVASSEQEDVP